MKVFTFVVTVTQSQASLHVTVHDVKGCAVWFPQSRSGGEAAWKFAVSSCKVEKFR